jgi:hypothetical protein
MKEEMKLPILRKSGERMGHPPLLFWVVVEKIKRNQFLAPEARAQRSGAR